MKKISKIMKGKKVLSIVLSALMLVATFNIALPVLMIGANAVGETIDGVSQKSVVSDANIKYDEYAANYLNGAGYSTGIVIPGLDPDDDYIIQGIAYYEARDWMLVTAYHNDGSSSKVFALDASTGNFAAMFSFKNPDGSVNTDHGGGIAISENNLYYSCGDRDRYIAYAPLSALENAPVGKHTVIQLVDRVEFVEIGSVSYDSKTAYSAYVCYDNGVLWMGNFYDLGAKLAGVTIAAAEYNAPANNDYNSMVFGYRLSGEDSASEWANLISGASDCKGNPSYAIALNNSIKDVQYAVVENGKLYLSRSYGSGAGNSLSFGFGETSYLTVADIDLSVPGDTPVTISTISTNSLDKTVMAYEISDVKNFPMMPMSEGLCVIDGDLFITFEGASNKYMNESSGITSIGNCEKPVDVIWQVDPYELMDQIVTIPEKSIYYEKVTSLSEIEEGEEYIIVHESPERDPVKQENILYALNSAGNFDGYKLSKSSASNVRGYNGMIGHAISDYDIVDEDNDGIAETLYLNDAEADDIQSVHWSLTKTGEDTYKITNCDSYFIGCNSLYFDEDQISMAPSNADFLNNIKIVECGNGEGGVWLSNNHQYYLWSNDGLTDSYTSKINAYYSANSATTPIYSDITEQKGTFHCDALNATGTNIINGSIPSEDSYSAGVFYIFKRVVDETASTYESRVYTNLGAELQADGTYKVELETYAISPNHYQYVGEKPTDYIIVADTSSSMDNSGSTGVVEFNGALKVNALSEEANTSDDNGLGVSGYGFCNADEQIYLKHTDGKFYRVYMAVNTTDLEKGLFWTSYISQKYYVYYIADDGLYYCVEDHAVNPVGRTQEEWKAWVDSGENHSDYSAQVLNSSRRAEDVYVGPHYRFDDVNSYYSSTHTRIQTLRNATMNLVDHIAVENPGNRIALVQFGGSTGFYNTSSTLSTTDYANAFWTPVQASDLKSVINNLTTSALTINDGTEFTYVNRIMENSGIDYTGADSSRNVAVIYLSDGVAGADSSKGSMDAANNIIAKALDAKKAGAFIYTVMIGADGTSFNRNLFMEAISSKYAKAASMTDLGGQSVDGVNYSLSLATTNMNNFITFGHVVLKEASVNNGVGLENLDANSYLREQLSEAFKFPENTADYDVDVVLVPGVFDKIGRFAFDEENIITDHSVKHEIDADNRTITVTNYNYSEQYVAKNRTTPGNKLRVTITGLVANEKADIHNTSINDITTTGLYKTKAAMNANKAFKKFPTSYFNIPEYVYVLDYDLPMYDADVNGTLLSVDGTPAKQSTYKTERVTEDIKLTFVNGNQDMTYELLSGVYSETDNTSFCLIERDDGSYDWFKLNIVPASNVLFEETKFESVSKDGAAAWTVDGTALNEYQTLADGNDRYGYDENYAENGAGYSNGTVKTTTVNSTTKRSETLTFSYTGTGFDLMAACGQNTGMQVVKISKVEGETKTPVKALIVDTYYNGELLNQVPIVKYEGEYGTYEIEITAAYLSTAQGITGSRYAGSNLLLGGIINSFTSKAEGYSVQSVLDELDIDIPASDVELTWFDDNSILNGGTGPVAKASRARSTSAQADVSLDCYVDSIRVYNPLGADFSQYIDSEKSALYYNIIDELAKVDDGAITGNGSFAAYVTGDLAPDAEGNIPALTYANYQSVGPQYEVYLENADSKSHAVSFKVNVPNDHARVMISLRAVNGTTKAKINDIDFEINTATEQYFDITPYLTVDDNGEAVVTITNIGAGILGVNNIKLVGAAVSPLSDEDLPVLSNALASESRTVEPNDYDYDALVVEEEEDVTVESDSTSISSLIKMLLDFIFSLLAKFF